MTDTPHPTPTEDLYFRAAMNGERGWHRAGPGAYARGTDGPAVILRRTEPDVLRALLRSGRPLHYVLDDDVASGWRDRRLPLAYRWRLVRLHLQTLRPLLRAGASLHVPSAALKRCFAAHADVSRIAPCHPVPPRDVPPTASHDRPRVAYLGTRSHRADIAAAAPALARWLAARPDARLVTFLGDRAPPALCAAPNAEHRAPVDWQAFQRFLRAERVHAVIAPGLATQFNAARSHSRLLDAAALGAVPVVSRHLAMAETVEREGLGLVIESDDWGTLLDRALADRDPAERLVRYVRDRHGPERQRAYWGRV